MKQAALDALWKINYSALNYCLWNVEFMEHDTFYYGDTMLNPRPLPPHIAIYEDNETKDWPELEQADMTIKTVRNEKIYIFIV